MNSYEIWSEGYRATGDQGGACFHGIGRGENFGEACEDHFDDERDPSGFFDRKELTYWGCRLYNSEADARATFG